MRQLDAEYRLAKNVKISMLYLEDDDAVAAEMYIKKASSLIANCKQGALDLQVQLVAAEPPLSSLVRGQGVTQPHAFRRKAGRRVSQCLVIF